MLRYRVNGSGVRDEEFDLVVLSVGLAPSAGNRDLAGNLAIEAERPRLLPQSRLFTHGDIEKGDLFLRRFPRPDGYPGHRHHGERGRVSRLARLLFEARHTMVAEKVYPAEREVGGEQPRIGIFVCDCGTNIAKVVSVPQVVEYAKGPSRRSLAVEETFACSVDSVRHIVEAIKKEGLNRVVVAACTPRTHEPVFQDTLREAGLNPFLFQFANIREHCSFVHMGDKAAATGKAKDLVRMAAARALLLQPLYRAEYGVTKAALVVGGGVAGMTAALALARQGIKVHLIEKNAEMGGLATRIPETLEGGNVRALVDRLVSEVRATEMIEVVTGAELLEHSGYVGNFSSKIGVGGSDTPRQVEHGVTIVASGAGEHRPGEYLYGRDPEGRYAPGS